MWDHTFAAFAIPAMNVTKHHQHFVAYCLYPNNTNSIYLPCT